MWFPPPSPHRCASQGEGGGEEGGWKGPGIFQAKCLYFRQKHLEKTKKILVCKKGTTLQSPKVLMPMYSSSTGKATLISLVLFYVDHWLLWFFRLLQEPFFAHAAQQFALLALSWFRSQCYFLCLHVAPFSGMKQLFPLNTSNSRSLLSTAGVTIRTIVLHVFQ